MGDTDCIYADPIENRYFRDNDIKMFVAHITHLSVINKASFVHSVMMKMNSVV